jgi:transposase
MTISEDLRIRLVTKVLNGMSRRQAAAHFEVSPSSAVRFAKRYDEEGSVAAKPCLSRKRRLDDYGDDILCWIQEAPDITLAELTDRLQEVHNVRAPKSTLDDWLRAQGLSFKKNRTRQ